MIESLEIPKADGKRIWSATAKLVENFKKPKPSAKKVAPATNVLDAVNALNAKRKAAAAAAAPGAGTQPKASSPTSPRATGNRP